MKVKGYNNNNDNDKPDTGIKVSKKVVTTQRSGSASNWTKRR